MSTDTAIHHHSAQAKNTFEEDVYCACGRIWPCPYALDINLRDALRHVLGSLETRRKLLDPNCARCRVIADFLDGENDG